MKLYGKYTLCFLGIFVVLHGLSFLAYLYPQLNSPLFLLFMGGSIAFVLRKPTLAPLPLILNLFLDSSGHSFEWHDVSLRLALLAVTLIGWLYGSLRRKDLLAQLNQPFGYIYSIILLTVTFAAYNGWMHGHDMRAVIADAIPFAYLSLYYPISLYMRMARTLRPASHRDEQTQGLDIQDYAKVASLVIGSFIGAALLSLITLFLFSSGLEEIQGPFYKWFRDILAGKITATGNGFFRIVTPLHLFLVALVPFTVTSFWTSLKGGNRISGSYRSTAFRSRMTLWMTISLILIVPAMNFSRMYFLAIIPATLLMMWPLMKKHGMGFFASLRMTGNALIIIGVGSFILYSGANLAASSGRSFGFEFLTGQTVGIIDPTSEASASARTAILPHLLEKIKSRPLLGEGLGATVTYYNPFFEKNLSTPHLDWGFLEVIVEYGLIFSILISILLAYLFSSSTKSILGISLLTFLLFTTITTPGLFHVYGILLILLVFLLLKYNRVDRSYNS